MTKTEQYESIAKMYDSGFSLSQVGEAFGLTRQTIYTGLKRRGHMLRSKKPLPFQIIDGVKFSLRNTGYYGKTYGDRKLAHRYVWEKHNGRIPSGHDVHHIDHDRSNNSITNLALYSKEEHARRFSTGHNQYTKQTKAGGKS